MHSQDPHTQLTSQKLISSVSGVELMAQNRRLTLRCCCDDRATFGDVRHSGTRQEERPVNIGLHRPVELLGRDVQDVRHRILRSVSSVTSIG